MNQRLTVIAGRFAELPQRVSTKADERHLRPDPLRCRGVRVRHLSVIVHVSVTHLAVVDVQTAGLVYPGLIPFPD